MQKSELSEPQLKNRTLMVETLSTHGWRGSLFNTQFDEGLWTSPEASMEYSHGSLSLRLDLKLDDPRVILYLESAEGKNLGLVFKCVDNLEPLLKTLVAVQDTISPDNIKDMSDDLLAACPEMFKISASGDELIPVTSKRTK